MGPKGEKPNYIKVITDKVNLCQEVFVISFLYMEKNGNIREVKLPFTSNAKGEFLLRDQVSSVLVVYSCFEKGCRKNCARDFPER